MLGWWKAWRRKKRLEQPFPEEWERLLPTRCRHFHGLSDDERQLLRERTLLFIDEKQWEGCNGAVVTAEMQVTIASHAALMGLGFPEIPFERLLSVLIYPDTFVARQPRRTPWGPMDQDLPLLGQAAYQGPVLFSWREVARDCFEAPAGRNVVIHEFAHLLDMADHNVDGAPALSTPEQANAWAEIVPLEFRKLQRLTEQGRRTLFDAYGATNEAEFFAVTCETFFERPREMAEKHPRLYELYRGYYRQDPAERALRVER